MFEFFYNPANLILGGALVSAPIIIHLINRLRYKRVRWAAIEFLLKSQKRNRRRLILEQLLLLAMRCLLVALAGLLLARFLGLSWAGFQPTNTLHVVILDDRLSMSDHWKAEDGQEKNSFQVGKELVEKEVNRLASQVRTPQRLVFFHLSDAGAVLDGRLNDDTLKQLSAELGRLDRPTFLHLDLVRGIEAAQAFFDHNPQDNRFLHLIGDFRQGHWGEPEGGPAMQKLESLARAGVKVHLVDCAHPYRSENQRTPLYHDNLAVIELRPETRIAAENMPVQFTVTVANYSPSERRNIRVTVKVNGAERLESSVPLVSLPPGRTSGTFQVSFNQLGFNEITANLEDEEAGLQADNVRYAVVEIRRQVPVLIIDGDLTNGDKPGGDLFHLRTLLTAARGYEVIRAGVSELERPTLEQFPAVYLLNVRDLNDRALKNLETYVAGGGSVAFFLGDRVNPDYYTRKLYAGGKGLFPAPLADRPSPALTEEEKQQRLLQNLADPSPQVLIRKPDHPIFAEVSPPAFRELFNFLSIDRHYPVARQKWTADPSQYEELATLPNDRPVADYELAASEILNGLPIDNPSFAKFRPTLEKHRRAIRDALGGKSLQPLASALEKLLQDPADFWKESDPKIRALHKRVEMLRERVQYGDPLVIAGRFGRGRTVAFFTTAGKAWNDWAGGGPASVTYPVVMLDLQKYLTSVEAEENRTVGTPLEIQADGARYDSKVHCFLQRGPREGEANPQANTGGSSFRDLGELLGTQSGNRLTFSFDKAVEPGIYRFDLSPRTEAGASPRAETRAYVFNVDTANESDLRRALRDELTRVGTVSTPATVSFVDLIGRPSDLSESAWFYLALLALLVAEQWLAVRLSHHLHGKQAQAPAQAPRPVAA
jgi:hypothetical protein